MLTFSITSLGLAIQRTRKSARSPCPTAQPSALGVSGFLPGNGTHSANSQATQINGDLLVSVCLADEWGPVIAVTLKAEFGGCFRDHSDVEGGALL